MIQKGDGEIARRLSNGLCPNCKTAIECWHIDVKANTISADCATCGLGIIDLIDGEKSETS